MDPRSPGKRAPGQEGNAIPELTGLLRAGLWISGLTIASKFLGLVREGVLAWAFGTSALVDAFRVSQTGVFLLVHLLAGSVLDSAFLPTFKHLLTGGHPRLAWLTARVLGRALTLAGLALCGLLLVAAPAWVDLLAPGFDDERRRLTILLLRAMSLAVPLAMLVNLFITLSTGLYRFRIPALRVLVQNATVLAGILLTLGLGSVLFLGLALPLAQLLMLLLLIPVLTPLIRPAVRGTRYRHRFAWRQLGVAFAPGMALVGLEQATVVVERIVASRLPEGSIASLDYARFLVETPMVTVGLGMTQVMLPTLSDLSAGGDRDRLRRSSHAYLIGALWGVFPIAIWLFVCGEDLVRLIYQRGAFGEESVRTTSEALFGFTVGLWAWFGGTIVLQKLLYAQRRLRPLIPLTAVSLVSFAVLAWWLAPSQSVRGVALAFSASQLIYFGGVLAMQGGVFLRATVPHLLYLITGAFVLGFLAMRIPGSTPWIRVGVGLLGITLGWILWSLPSRELRALGWTLARRVIRRSSRAEDDH